MKIRFVFCAALVSDLFNKYKNRPKETQISLRRTKYKEKDSPRYHSNCAVKTPLRLYQAVCLHAAVTERFYLRGNPLSSFRLRSYRPLQTTFNGSHQPPLLWEASAGLSPSSPLLFFLYHILFCLSRCFWEIHRFQLCPSTACLKGELLPSILGVRRSSAAREISTKIPPSATGWHTNKFS